MTFLEKLTNTIYSEYGDDISDICIVLPNRRAGLYLKKYLAEKLSKVIWSPSIFSIEDFVCYITNLKLADQTTLLFDLYNVYKTIEEQKAQPFDEFINWAQILINDYNDSDTNLADTASLFQYLNEAKAINAWNLDITPLTEHEKDYLNFYNSLSKYYDSFTKLLLSKNTGYQGLIYKKAAEKVEEYVAASSFSKVIFAGFNALTASEEKIIKTFISSGKAEIFWDVDDYYLQNEIHEAGFFIRKYRKEWGLKEFNWIEEHFKNDEKNITITGVPLHLGQTELAGQLISQMNEETANSEKTAIVLADENLLTPLLYSIPQNVTDINITMGYPLSASSLHSLFISIFTLHENSKKYSSNNVLRFYQKDIISLMNHPYIRLIGNGNSDVNSVEESIKKSNRIFYKSDEILSKTKEAGISFLFGNVSDNPNVLLDKFTQIIELVRDSLIKGGKNKNNDIDIEFLFNYAVIITKVRNLATEYGFIKDIKTLRKIFTGLAETATIPFYGEPLKGLQIMGMLETRSLDFENIILLSANENILPAGKFQNTFIPFDIRKEFGLSTYKQKESIFAYHFYRLLQRAKNIHIIYNTQSDDFGSGEKSRFITQICEELPRYNNKINIRQNLLINESIPAKKVEVISVIKSKEILNDLEKLAEKGLSPSAFNTYISCSLRFYFQYIEKIEETEEVAETIDAATLGSAVHYVLKELYNDFKGKVLKTEDIKNMAGRVETLTMEGFKKYYQDGDVEVGKNLLIAKVAIRFINNFLQTEKAFIEELNKSNETLTIVRLEEPVETISDLILSNGKSIQLKIKGFIDRVDMAGNTLRIIDYKTGLVNKDELKFNSWEELVTDSDLAKSLQLLTYAYLFSKKYYAENVNAGIITFRSLSKGFLPVICPEGNSNIDKESILQIEREIKNLVLTMLNPDIPFEQTDDIDICRYCQYAAICNCS